MTVCGNNTSGLNTVQNQNQKHHFAALDGWRFWAALIIVLHHSIRRPYFVQEVGPVFWLSTAAMTFFFMLSGFVTAASVKDKQWDFSSTLNYYAARLIRIWPPHFLALLAVLILWFIQKRTFFIGIFSANFLLLQSWFPTPNYYYSYNAVSWYLSTLMGLYLMMPLFVRYFKICLFFSLTLLLLLCLVIPKEHNEYFFYICPFSDMFKFLSGMVSYKLGSYIYGSQFHSQENISRKLFFQWSGVEIAIIMLVFFAVVWCVPPLFDFSLKSFEPGTGIWILHKNCAWIAQNILVPLFIVFFIVFSLERGIVSRLLTSKIALVLGKISFILFLWHTYIRDIIIRYDLFHQVPMQWRLILYVVISILVAFPLEYCINSPVTRWLNIFHKNHPLHLESFWQYVPLVAAIGTVLLYLGCIIPRPVDYTLMVFDSLTSVCDKSLPVQVKSSSKKQLFIHPGKKPTSAIFQLNRRIDKFSCNLQTGHKKADVIVKFYLDEKLVKTIHAAGKDKVHRISIPCSKAGQLRIEVDKNGKLLCDGTVLKSVSFTGYPN